MDGNRILDMLLNGRLKDDRPKRWKLKDNNEESNIEQIQQNVLKLDFTYMKKDGTVQYFYITDCNE